MSKIEGFSHPFFAEAEIPGVEQFEAFYTVLFDSLFWIDLCSLFLSSFFLTNQ